MPNKKSGDAWRYAVLQRKVSVDDSEWKYRLPNLQNRQHNSELGKTNAADGEKVTIKFIKFGDNGISLSYEKQSINRILLAEKNHLERFILVSFQGFNVKPNEPKERKATAEYIERFLNAGVYLSGERYIFYGHSNSQLKSRTCYLYNAVNDTTITKKINSFGDFSKCQSIAKKAKRIGLLFTAAEASVDLNPKFTEDIPDVETDGHTFTDGCGMLSYGFAKELAQKRQIIFHNQRYTPSAFQIRYKGYKGMLMVNKELDNQGTKRIKAQFRKSMSKFGKCPDNNFSVLDYSKPFTFAFLNGELVTLLSSLGITNEVFLKKQEDYFNFLENAFVDPKTSYEYLCYKGEVDLAEQFLLGEKTEEIKKKIKKLTREEFEGSFKKNNNKEDEERVRIMIPDSRILFGVCDYTGSLQEGECHVRVTSESRGPMTVTGLYVIVSRNPCLHPGDIRKFKAVQCDALSHLVDCIVFPIVGKRDPASLMSGGDLDGDKFFVSWDKDLIPKIMSEPYGYPAANQPTKRDIKYTDMIHYFANYNNSSLGRVKNLYLDWARASPEGAASAKCQELNVLFSSCVDGERIKVPEHLEKAPTLTGPSTFIIDILCEAVKKKAITIFKNDVESVETTSLELLECILAENTCCLLNEFELFKLTARWCQLHGVSIDEFICYFDFGNFTSLQRCAVVSMLNNWYWSRLSSDIGRIFNGLYYSEILRDRRQLDFCNLSNWTVRWQQLYSSYFDDGEEILKNLSKALEMFQKKLLVFNVDEQLTVAVYIPVRIERLEELNVEKRVKMFAFNPLSGENYRESTVPGYKIYFDGEILQIYDKVRPNTFIWLALNKGFRKRAGIKTQQAPNPKTEFKVSIALQKFNQTLARTHGRVTKHESYGFEIYVISNRDREGHDILDMSMNNVETKKIMKTLQNTPRNYSLLDLDGADWTNRTFCEEIIAKSQISKIIYLVDICEFEQVLNCCINLKHEDKLLDIINFALRNLDKFIKEIQLLIVPTIMNYLETAPILGILMTQCMAGDFDLVDEEGRRQTQRDFTAGLFRNCDDYFDLMLALLRCINDLKDAALKQFKRLPEFMFHQSIKIPVFLFTNLIKEIVFNVRDVELAKECIESVLSEEFPILEVINTDAAGNNSQGQELLIRKCEDYYKRTAMALAIDYLGEANEKCPCDFWGIPFGAEKLDEPETKNNKNSYAKRTHTVAEFVPSKYTEEREDRSENSTSEENSDRRGGTRDGKPIEPDQKCVDVKPSPKDNQAGIYETILRIDVPSKIRNEDHLRFCATRRPDNASKRRPTVFDAVVKSVQRGKLEFTIKQMIPKELETANWNIYICGSSTNLSTMFSALETLIAKKMDSTVAFNDIIGLNENCTNGTNNGDHETHAKIQIPSGKFNESQLVSIKTAVANPLTLIWGPPGTGKTTVVVEIILQFLKLYPGKRLLVTASTHKAVDNVMERFLKNYGGDQKSTEDFIRLTTDVKNVSPALQGWTMDAFCGVNIRDNDAAKGKAAKKVKLAKIIFSTCSGAGVGLLRLAGTAGTHNSDEDNEGKKKKKKKDEKFDIVIVDEASQITEPNTLIPLVKCSKFIVLVGDHVQLRPQVSEISKEYGFETSLFQKLYESTNTQASKIMLNVQYRMHPELAKFPSRKFYRGELRSGVRAEDRILPQSEFPWPSDNFGFYPSVFVNCGAEESYGKSKANRGQALLTTRILDLLLTGPSPSTEKDIKILTPYRSQLTLIQTLLKSRKGVDVCTIDEFQGREAEIIIFSTVRANCRKNLGFLDDHRRINVAVTRAKRGLIVIGHEPTIKDDEFWKELLDSCKKVELPPAPAPRKDKK